MRADLLTSTRLESPEQWRISKFVPKREIFVKNFSQWLVFDAESHGSKISQNLEIQRFRGKRFKSDLY